MADTYDPANDYYSILGLTAPTTTQAVQAAFLRKLEALSPPDESNARQREKLQEAWYHLSDVVRRAAYDKVRVSQRRPAPSSVSGPGRKSGKITAYEPASQLGLQAIEQQVLDRPDDLDTLSWLAFQYYSSGVLDKSLEAYGRYLAKRPDDADAHYYVARALQKSGRPKEALPHFRRVVELVPGTDRAERAADSLREAGG